MSTLNLKIYESACNKTQWRALNSRARGLAVFGGVGSGKSYWAGLKLLQLKAANPGVPGLLMAQSWRQLFAVTLRRFLGIIAGKWPRGLMPRVRDKMGECFLDFGDGAPVFLRTAENVSGYDGLDVGYLVGDELRHWRKESFDIAIARVRVPCPFPQSAFASTPLIGWMEDEFLDKPNREMFIAPTSENAHNLAPGFIENLRQSYSPRLQRAIIDGEFCALFGAVYEMFDGSLTSPWIIDWQPTQKDFDRCPVYLALDPGWRRSAWLFIIERGPMDWVVFDQLMLDNTSDMDAVAKVNMRGYPIDEIWTDPAADATQSSEGTDTIMALRHIEARSSSSRVLYSTGQKARGIPFGVDKLRVLLGGYDGYPRRIHFTRALAAAERGQARGIIKDLSAYRYPEMKEGRPVTDMPLKDGVVDHGNDALRYFAVSRWLRVPQLRSKDRELLKSKHLGYKVA